MKTDRFSYVSNDASLLQLQRYMLQEGKASGVQMIRVSNAVGLELHLVADRALDIAELRFHGVSIGYLSATGITHPSYYEKDGYSWLRSFYGGFLTTCGLDQVGEPCEHAGTSHGLHGRIANLPAYHLCTDLFRENGRLVGVVQGTISQASQQGEAYLMRRTYRFYDDSASFVFIDEIENQTNHELPLQLLYHFNFGYPFLSPSLQISIPQAETTGWDEASHQKRDAYADCTDSQELTLLHQLRCSDGIARLVLCNHGIQLSIEFDANHLPILGQWRYLQPREYVLSFEPSNNHLRGIAWECENGSLELLQPGEKKRYEFRVCLQQQ